MARNFTVFLGGVGAPEVTSYYLGDGIGSVHEIVSPAGAVQRLQLNTALGEDLPGFAPLGTFKDRHGFTQREKDEESGVMHYRARSYDPRTGRFIQKDPPMERRPGHHYVYADNLPTGFMDPFGIDVWTADQIRQRGLSSMSNQDAWDTYAAGYSKSGDEKWASVQAYERFKALSASGSKSLIVAAAAGAVEGTKGGYSIVTNTFTGGWSDRIGLTESTKYQGADYDWSRRFATVSKTAAYFTGMGTMLAYADMSGGLVDGVMEGDPLKVGLNAAFLGKAGSLKGIATDVNLGNFFKSILSSGGGGGVRMGGDALALEGAAALNWTVAGSKAVVLDGNRIAGLMNTLANFMSGGGGGGQPPPPLKRLHPDSTLESGSNKFSLEYWRKQKTEDIVESLKPGRRDSLKVKPDGTVMDGNTRIKALEERGYDVNSLPREPIKVDKIGPLDD